MRASNDCAPSYCGFDFGTSNSAIGIITDDGPELVRFQDDPVIRSAIFADTEERTLRFGAAGVQDYLDGIPGRLIMAIKTVLGSSLMDERTPVAGRWIPFTDVLGLLLGHIKDEAERAAGTHLDHVVLGRPVRFSDTDDAKDARAQSTLHDIAKSVGFREVEFQYEPVAAAMSFESRLSREALCCVIDLGGGTADYSVIRLGPGRLGRDRSVDVLANHGVHIGGTDLDYRLSLETTMRTLGHGSHIKTASGQSEVSSYTYHELSRWHRIFDQYKPEVRQALRTMLAVSDDVQGLKRLIGVLEKRLGHQLLNAVEACKQTLSKQDSTTIALDSVESMLEISVGRDNFVDAIRRELHALDETLEETFKRAGVRASQVDYAFLTGGTGLIPAVQEVIQKRMAPVELVLDDPFTAVARGLTLDAAARFG